MFSDLSCSESIRRVMEMLTQNDFTNFHRWKCAW